MEPLIIRQVPIGSFKVFTYIVACPESRLAAIIDPAGEPERIVSLLSEEDLQAAFILNTHGHADHILANDGLRAALRAPVGMHRADAEFFSDPDARQQIAKELGVTCDTCVDVLLEDGQVLDMGKQQIWVIHTPGHTPGSVCFLINGNLFTGDTLFVGAAGRTDLAGGSLDMLIASIRDKLLTLPGDTLIWPGHDYGDSPSSTIAREMEENIYVTDFIFEN